MFGNRLHPSTCLTGIMAKAALYLLAMSLLLSLRSGDADAGEIYVEPVTQFAPQGSKAMFFCEGVGQTMHWVIKDVVISHSNEPTYEGRGFVFNGTRVIINEYESLYNLTLHVPSIDANNNTKIECLTMGDQTSQSKPAYLIVLGRPSPVNPRLQYLTATTLRVLWEPPFTWEGYGITEYEVLVKNMTSGEKIVNRNVLGPRFELEAPMGLTASTCNELKVSVVAKTDLGASDPAVLPVWFPIAIKSFALPETEVLFSSVDKTSDARVRVTFYIPDLCDTQRISYSVVVRESAHTPVVARVDRTDYIVSAGPIVVEMLDGLEKDKDYEVTVSIDGVTGGRSAVSKFRTSLTDDPEVGGVSDDNEDDALNMYIIIGIAAGGTVIIVLLVLITIVTIVNVRRRNRRRGQNGGKRSMTNPIYEGPLYETIVDASLSTSSGSPAETPTVVRESPYFGNQIHPTYENGNTARFPSLNLPPQVTGSCEDSYTIMSSAAKKSNEEARPAPDVIRYVKTD